MTSDKDKKLWASLFMMLLIASPLTVMSDDTFCTKSWTNVYFADYIGGALLNNGSYYAWGVNQFGGLGTGNNIFQTVPARVGNASSAFTQMALNLYYTLALGANNKVYGWGSNVYGNLDNAVALGAVQYTPALINSLGNCTYIATHGLQYTSYAIKQNGKLFGFGDNSHAQLGIATASLSSTSTPRQIGPDSNWASVFPAKRDSHVCGIKTNGNLFCWGENYYGQVGDGSNADRASPYRIGSASDVWQAVYPVLYGTIALHQNGTVWAWGTTFYGLFADGSDYSSSSVPKQIASGMKALAVHDNYLLAVGTNGKLYGWGDNRYNQVSSAAVGIQNTVNQVTSGTNWDKVFVSVGIQMNAVGSAFAVRTNGNLYAWGLNDVGQLGLGSASSVVSTPTQVSLGTLDVVSVVSVGYDTGIIDNKGQIHVTGFNNFNLLGDGTIDSSNAFHSCQDRTKTCNNHVCV